MLSLNRLVVNIARSSNYRQSPLSRRQFRTHSCGNLDQTSCGSSQVTISGWLRSKRMSMFGVLTDSTGSCQFVVEKPHLRQSLRACPLNSVVSVKGVLRPRPSMNISITGPCGSIELLADELTVISPLREPLPFDHDAARHVDESTRLKYRYLDLRSDRMQEILRYRSNLLHRIRQHLHSRDFLEVETPCLTFPTSGGAAEFSVRGQHAGNLALSQSPQLYKQMLMVAYVPKYFQIARCFRDERCKSQRQLEFTQLDMEMSFSNAAQVHAEVEKLFADVISDTAVRFAKLRFKTSMHVFGTDKPATMVSTVQSNGSSISGSRTANHVLHRILCVDERYIDAACNLPSCCAVGHVDGEGNASVLRGVLEDGWDAHVCKEPNSLVIAGPDHYRLPMDVGNVLIWIVDRPLYTLRNGQLHSDHHPFTSPAPGNDPCSADALASSYDLVWKGEEIGGGSVRIHDPDVQRQVLRKLELDESHFFHFLRCLGLGAPPHCGIAIGMDRLVYVLLKDQYELSSIRDVIAFPRYTSGSDPLLE